MIQDVLFKPESSWECPTSFPDLRNVRTIGLDTETKDPGLNTSGPGFIRGDAEVAGVSVATTDKSWYFPVGHFHNIRVDREGLGAWLTDLLADTDGFIVGANLGYDLESLSSLGVTCRRRVIDVQIAGALINEESQQGYSLGALCREYLGGNKEEDLLREAASAFGVDAKRELWKLDPKYVGPYAEWDAQAPIKIFEKMLPILKQEDLESVFQMECELLPILLEMRQKGIPINEEAADKVSKSLEAEENELRVHFLREWGVQIDEWSTPQLAKVFDEHGIPYPRTAKGNPSITKDVIAKLDHPLSTTLQRIRHLNRMRSTAIDGWIRGNLIAGRIHPNWVQLKSDDGGTRTGRMASKQPNAQQFPSKNSRDGTINVEGQLIRSMFIPDKGYKWAKLDYSQQEPRILTHYARQCELDGATEAASQYINNPDMDFYQYLVDAAGIPRRVAKTMYLGLCYGMGSKHMAEQLNRSEAEAKEVISEFNEKVPFVKQMAELSMSRASSRGYIRTLAGRRRHFKFYEPRGFDNKRKPLPHDQARQAYRGEQLQRAWTFKALNALIQGSAADMMKKAIIAVRKELDIVPYMTVHDELNCPVVDEEQAGQIKKVMETCVEMCVPLKADMDVGDSWI